MRPKQAKQNLCQVLITGCKDTLSFSFSKIRSCRANKSLGTALRPSCSFVGSVQTMKTEPFYSVGTSGPGRKAYWRPGRKWYRHQNTKKEIAKTSSCLNIRTCKMYHYANFIHGYSEHSWHVIVFESKVQVCFLKSQKLSNMQC